MSWGPIQLRLKGSHQVEFDGEASPAPGGGSEQATYGDSASFTVPDSQALPVPFDTLTSGPELLDRSVPAAPTFLAAGLYAVTFQFYCTDPPLTAGGYVIAHGVVGNANVAGGIEVAHPASLTGFTVVGEAAAGDGLSFTISNYDGAATRQFIASLAVVKH